MIIESIDVTKIYETRGVETRALDGVSLALEKGEFTALAGPSVAMILVRRRTRATVLTGLDEPFPTSGFPRLETVVRPRSSLK